MRARIDCEFCLLRGAGRARRHADRRWADFAPRRSLVAARAVAVVDGRRQRLGPYAHLNRHFCVLSSSLNSGSVLQSDLRQDRSKHGKRALPGRPPNASKLAAGQVVGWRRRAGGMEAELVDGDGTASGLAGRREIAGEIAARIDGAVRAGHLPAQDTALAATALLGGLHESLVGPLAPDNLDD